MQRPSQITSHQVLVDIFMRLCKSLNESVGSIEQVRKLDAQLLGHFTNLMLDKVFEEQKKLEQEVQQMGSYERSLQKLEAEVRQHIRVEQQMKLCIEGHQSKIEELEKQLKQAMMRARDRRLIEDQENQPVRANVRTEASQDLTYYQLKKKIEVQAEKRRIILSPTKTRPLSQQRIQNYYNRLKEDRIKLNTTIQ